MLLRPMCGFMTCHVQEKADSPGVALPMLLDTSHSHCYREDWATYDRPASYSTMPSGGHGKTIYQPRPLAALSDKPDYFLRALPEVVWTSDSLAARSSLVEIPCNGRSK